MKIQRARLVAVSALALNAAHFTPAWAQLQINCAQRLEVGEHIACGNGTFTIHPDGSTTPGGCLVTTTPPQPGQCLLTNNGVPPTRDVIVEFTNPTLVLNGAGKTAKVEFLRMQPVGETVAKAQYIFTPTDVSNGVTLNIGGRLAFSNGQAIGSYTGTVSITANLQ